jgi:hypothetical protein
MFELCQAIALGRSVYEMVAGHRPYPEDGPADLSDGKIGKESRGSSTINFRLMFLFFDYGIMSQKNT